MIVKKSIIISVKKDHKQVLRRKKGRNAVKTEHLKINVTINIQPENIPRYSGHR